MAETTEKVVVIGASTGGTEALRQCLNRFPRTLRDRHCAAYAGAIHARLRNRLDGLCNITVKEAESNDTVIRGRALIAPGNHHLLLKRSGARYYVEIKDGPLVCRHRPSVDVLFRSAARLRGQECGGRDSDRNGRRRRARNARNENRPALKPSRRTKPPALYLECQRGDKTGRCGQVSPAPCSGRCNSLSVPGALSRGRRGAVYFCCIHCDWIAKL